MWCSMTVFPFQRFVSMLAVEEMKISQLMSLTRKFRETDEASPEEMNLFLCDLLQPKEVEVPGGPAGSLGTQIKTMFLNAQRVRVYQYY